METLLKDARYGLRMLLRSPGFTVVALLSLALGIGANTAIFSMISAFMFAPLPVEHDAPSLRQAPPITTTTVHVRAVDLPE